MGPAQLHQILSIILILLASSLGVVLLVRERRSVVQRRDMHSRIDQLEAQISRLHQQVKAGFLLSDYLLEAQDQQSVVRAAMNAGYELLGASGCSFTSFNEWRPSWPRLVRGRIPDASPESWAVRLTSPATRQACKICQNRQPEGECILLEGTQGYGDVYCVALRHAGRELGVLNYFFEARPSLDEGTHLFLSEMVRTVDLAIGSLREPQAAVSPDQPQEDLSTRLSWLLQSLRQDLAVEFVWLWIPEEQVSQAPFFMQCPQPSNKLNAADLIWLNDLWRRLLVAEEPSMLEDVALPTEDGGTSLHNLAFFPLTWQGAVPLGLLVLGGRSTFKISKRQSMLLQTLAGQAAILIQEDRMRTGVEYKAVLDERTRLAREIHDGLAQTLAFLKLEAAHMQDYLARGQIEALNKTLLGCYRTLSDAYLDARQAIEDLRHTPDVCLEDWLRQAAQDFEQITGLPVEIVDLSLSRDFSPSVRAQLARIFQEALTNIRKHAQASRVKLAAWEKDGLATLELSDDGVGFPPEYEVSQARYGLRGMRERAEMIGADFQIISQPERGTTVRLQIPVREGERL